ncbi:MAG: hypothetical protein ACI358_03015 [Candidatus Limimorpha sp.]
MRYFLLVLSILLTLAACTKQSEIIGTWTVDKISFDFDEKRNTPEMIHQAGILEKQNTLTFRNDSIVHINMGNINADYKYKLDENGTINLEPDTHITRIEYDSGTISTEIITPLGKVTISYKKNNNF